MKLKQIIHKLSEAKFSGMFFYLGTLLLYIAIKMEGVACILFAILSALIFDIAVMLSKKNESTFIISDEGMKQLKEFVEEYENHKS